ncbi:MAG: hypothetical protein GX950_03640 [Candidatus Diapherotrites archaeon]|jgi:hypothetical protein|uniref:AI-2E family transporter n=1 Tax=Candidatus Iainarchaeum sp. TaxID=3101447 RepID=A0A7K4C0B3_9ARCH|nr:hypothetical protein [Candidatus Diapherotrites archaeon]
MSELDKKIDGIYSKIQKKVTGSIAEFVAFFFFVITLGSLVTIYIITQFPQHAFWVVLTPALAGIISYYNRTFATIIFLGILLLLILL